MEHIFGTQHNVNLWQESARAALVFAYGFLVLRITGRRTFGKWSALDFILSVVIGSALARVITGEAAIDGTFLAVAVMVALHLLLAWCAAHNDLLSHLIEGSSVVLSKDGTMDENVRKAHLVSNADVAEAIRGECLGGIEDITKTKRLHLEPSGKISVVKLNS